MTSHQFPRRARQLAAGGELTPAQFHVVATLIGSYDPARAAARLVLVEGMHPTAAAEVVGVSRTSAYNAAARVRKAHQSIRDAYSPQERAMRPGATTPPGTIAG